LLAKLEKDDGTTRNGPQAAKPSDVDEQLKQNAEKENVAGDVVKSYTKEQMEGVQRGLSEHTLTPPPPPRLSKSNWMAVHQKVDSWLVKHIHTTAEIGNAYAVLSNPEKRKQYDLSGCEERMHTNHRNGGFDYHRGFEADITPEDLFNMFFGGGFPSANVRTYSNGRTTYSQHQHHSGHDREDERGDGGFSMLIQLMPIIVLILVSLLSQLMVSNPPYSLYPRSGQTIKRLTENLQVPYYVSKDFQSDYSGMSLQKLEKNIEEDYVANKLIYYMQQKSTEMIDCERKQRR
ncbi:hypothetical protein AB205_0044450, partial [Aquarana catesbeiana]